MALREYVPGNLIYANGQKFVPRLYHLEATDPVNFHVNLVNEAIAEAEAQGGAAGLGALTLRAVPICDVDLPHQQHIHDEEDHRFQIGVVVLGHEQGRHSGGQAYQWGEHPVQFRKAVHFRLVNVGVSPRVRSDEPHLGYPLCLVTGQSRSPLASQVELDDFRNHHLERYGREVEDMGFYADVVADAFSIQNCADPRVAYSLVEALRIAGAQVLDMEVEDLQVLCLPRINEQAVDAVLYDPMPGGSGLIEEMIERWPEVQTAAVAFLDGCPSRCETACIDCLMHFRNAHYHHRLDRHAALRFLRDAATEIRPAHPIPPRLPSEAREEQAESTNPPEARLLEMLRRAGFPEPIPQRRIAIGQPWGSTIPDFFYEDSTDPFDGICIYLDGLSSHIHGNPETRERDRQIRQILREMNHEVLEIPATALDDRDRMIGLFYRLARLLMGRDQAQRLRENTGWF